MFVGQAQPAGDHRRAGGRGRRTTSNGCTLPGRRGKIAEKILKEIRARLQFLVDVGLNYLTLDRSAETLSGGEAQRIRLASQIGAGLVGVMYILDEPSIGLHQRDNDRLLGTLTHLRDLGNTVLVVEHDEEAIRAADHIIDIGPGAGVHGGRIVAQGTAGGHRQGATRLAHRRLPVRATEYRRARRAHDPATADAAAASAAPAATTCRTSTVELPLGLLTCVTGVSGSGKSTLINDTLYPMAATRAQQRHHPDSRAPYDGIEGLEHLDKVRGHRPEPHRPHAALQPGHLHRHFHAHPRTVRRHPGGPLARLQARPLQLQRQGRTLRGLPGRRRDQGGDALPARYLRALRRLQGQALQPRNPGGPLQGQEHPRGAGDDRGGGAAPSSTPCPPWPASCRR
ncbi:MAG: hypothetical protein U5Q16_09270 [Gammaproteobacteria bacterium]|nr:hypothetical protein [Gammaproteobacteria bacterium]